MAEKNKNALTSLAPSPVVLAEPAAPSASAYKQQASDAFLKPPEQKKAIPCGKEFSSVGKKLHNEITYRGVDWLLNSTFGVAFAYVTAKTKIGQKLWSTPIENGFKKVLKPVFKTDELVKQGAEWGGKFLSIMMGGTAIIPVMSWLEKKENKKNIIHCVDEKHYGKETVRKDPRFAEQDKRIDEEPKKDFWTGMAARFIALAPLIAVTIYKPTNNIAKKYLYEPIASCTKKLTNMVGIKPGNMLREGEHIMDAKGGQTFQSNWDYLHETIGFDVGLTMFYSVLHEMAFKGLAALGVKKDKTPATPLPAAPAGHVAHEPAVQPAASSEEPASTHHRKAINIKEKIIKQPEAFAQRAMMEPQAVSAPMM